MPSFPPTYPPGKDCYRSVHFQSYYCAQINHVSENVMTGNTSGSHAFWVVFLLSSGSDLPLTESDVESFRKNHRPGVTGLIFNISLFFWLLDVSVNQKRRRPQQPYILAQIPSNPTHATRQSIHRHPEKKAKNPYLSSEAIYSLPGPADNYYPSIKK